MITVKGTWSECFNQLIRCGQFRGQFMSVLIFARRLDKNSKAKMVVKSDRDDMYISGECGSEREAELVQTYALDMQYGSIKGGPSTSTFKAIRNGNYLDIQMVGC